MYEEDQILRSQSHNP